MSSFGTVDFKVMAKNGYWPTPSRGRDGAEHYQATIQLDTQADYDELAAYLSEVTVNLAIGAFIGEARVDKGPGSAVLDVPIGKGARILRTAILVSFDLDTSGTTAGRFRGSVDFLCLGVPA